MALIFPIDGRILIYGYWFSVTLLSCFFQHGKLIFIILNRANNRIFNASKFVADSVHLFHNLGAEFQTRRTAQGKPILYNRQSVPETLTIYVSAPNYSDFATKRLNRMLSPFILQYGSGETEFLDMLAFLKATGPCGWFLPSFVRTCFPPGYSPPLGIHIPKILCQFKQSMGEKKECLDKINCSCSAIIDSIKSHQEKDMARLAFRTVSAVPTNLCLQLIYHFAPFVSKLSQCPERLYFPKGDALLCCEEK